MSTVSVVVPTFNEAGNVAELVRRIETVAAAAGVVEVLFVDDSSDDTPQVISAVAERSTLAVRLLHRRAGERDGGLSGAVVLGIEASLGEWSLVMDGDLQHPPEDIVRIMAAATGPVRGGGPVDAVVASRYCDGGASDGLAGVLRRVVSTTSTRLTIAMFPRLLQGCTDTMTGFFAVRRSAIRLEELRPRGFKVLLEILTRQRLKVIEVPFRFAERHSGHSKATFTQGTAFVAQLARLRWDLWRTGAVQRAPAFAVIGVINLVLDTALFNVVLHLGDKPLTAKAISSGTAVVASYLMNRRWTWGDRPRSRTWRGLGLFAGHSLVGVAIAEVCLLVSHYLLHLTSTLADNVSANVVGLGLGLLWRFFAYDRWVFPAGPADELGQRVVHVVPIAEAPVLDLREPSAARSGPTTGGTS